MSKTPLHFLFIFTLFFVTKLQAQDTSHISIRLITCSPGTELYSTFGHTALRIIDSAKQTDIVFNYGYFNFNEPNFYLKFIRGKLNYWLEPEQFNEFLSTYIEEKRSVQEQRLLLTYQEKQAIIQALAINLKGNNRFYKYDFLLDNCTTRIRDLLFTQVKNITLGNNLIPKNTTARDLIHSYLDKGGEPWSKLGIDILLGSELDKPLTNKQTMFLPDYLMHGIEYSKVDKSSIAVDSHLLLDLKTLDVLNNKNEALFSVIFICILFVLIYLFLPQYVILIHLLDSFLLLITGLLGLLLLFMWFGTDHTVCKNNLNLLWAMPVNLVAIYFIWKPKTWFRFYFLIISLILFLVLLGWLCFPTLINNALIPIIVLLIFRNIKKFIRQT